MSPTIAKPKNTPTTKQRAWLVQLADSLGIKLDKAANRVKDTTTDPAVLAQCKQIKASVLPKLKEAVTADPSQRDTIIRLAESAGKLEAKKCYADAFEVWKELAFTVRAALEISAGLGAVKAPTPPTKQSPPPSGGGVGARVIKEAKLPNEKIPREKESVAGPGETVPRVAKGVPALAAAVGTTAPAAAAATTPDPAKLSGKTWWGANEGNVPYKKGELISELDTDFQAKVKEFEAALKAAGVNPSIDTTTRSKERAYILHYAWLVAKGTTKASAVPAMAGVDIVWDHGDDTKSKAGAQEIVTAASVKSTPSLTSMHIEGKAIDWTITWTGDLTITQKNGKPLVIKSEPKNGGDPGNTELHAVGAGYGVHKGLNFNPLDPPHWSSDGS